MLKKPFCSIWLVVCLAACGKPADTPLSVKPGEWKAVLQIDNVPADFSLQIMNIYLVEEDDRYPEAFEIVGDNLHLVGKFPMDLHVGYEEALDRLVNRPIEIMIQVGEGADYGIENKFSTITLPGSSRQYVKSGSITFKKLTGKSAGQDGDRTLSGEITLTIDTESGPKTVTGQISVHAVSWG